MRDALQTRLARLDREGGLRHLADGRRGLEKESLRVDPSGGLSKTPHPPALGSALTHPWITTDYSEALLEFVTPPLDVAVALGFLADVHRFVYRQIGDEMLWATSMPCGLQGDESVPIAEYGTSNVGRMKHVYRRGLGLRYGRAMQAIAGVHFNFSMADDFWPAWQAALGDAGEARPFRDAAWFGLLRNYRRHGWLVLYLFGASPAVCESFAGAEALEEFTPGTRYAPWATTLRMSDLGYRNANQAGIAPSMNDPSSYNADLDRAIHTSWPAYRDLGVRVDDDWQQLSDSILQIENEYYGFIRPKAVAHSGERPTHALQRAGVEYVEVRALDVSPFHPEGVSLEQLRFMEVFLTWCLLDESPMLDDSEAPVIEQNQRRVACRGREPGLALADPAGEVPLARSAAQIMDDLRGLASVMDGANSGPLAAAVEAVADSVDDPANTPSARILAVLEEAEASFHEFAHEMSRRHRETLLASPYADPAREAAFAAEVTASMARQSTIEAADSVDFETYLARYFAGTVGSPSD